MEGDSSKGINPLIQSPEGEVSTVSHPLSSLPPMRHKKITKAPLHYQLAHPLTPVLITLHLKGFEGFKSTSPQFPLITYHLSLITSIKRMSLTIFSICYLLHSFFLTQGFVRLSIFSNSAISQLPRIRSSTSLAALKIGKCTPLYCQK